MTPPDRRTDPPLQADEAATVLGFLDYQRQTPEWKCAGLTPQQLATRAVPTSGLTLLGMVRHLAAVETGWLVGFGGLPPDIWPDAVRSVVSQLPLDTADRPWGRDEAFSLRWILVHLVEEYARHDGHADLIREALDGVTGE